MMRARERPARPDAGRGQKRAGRRPTAGGKQASAPAWLVLIVRLPPNPSSLRVRAWRRLRAVGAVALKNSVYLLPVTPQNQEHFQWLAQEVQKDGGEGTLLKVAQIENMAPAEVIRLFQAARDDDYRALAEQYRRLLRAMGRSAKGRAARRHERLAWLAREVARIREVDFFDARGYAEVERLKAVLDLRLQAPAPAAATPALDRADYRGRRWVTRPRPHVDRLASAWLIKRFIDVGATFLFAAPAEFPPDAVGFDAPGATFSHEGEECTFETLLRRFALRDARLAALAEIVHDLDLRDERFGRPEAPGLDLALRGLLATSRDDRAVLAHGLTLFDALYAALRPAAR